MRISFLALRAGLAPSGPRELDRLISPLTWPSDEPTDVDGRRVQGWPDRYINALGLVGARPVGHRLAQGAPNADCAQLRECSTWTTSGYRFASCGHPRFCASREF